MAKKVSTTWRIDGRLLDALRERAAADGTTATDVVESALRSYLGAPHVDGAADDCWARRVDERLDALEALVGSAGTMEGGCRRPRQAPSSRAYKGPSGPMGTKGPKGPWATK